MDNHAALYRQIMRTLEKCEAYCLDNDHERRIVATLIVDELFAAALRCAACGGNLTQCCIFGEVKYG